MLIKSVFLLVLFGLLLMVAAGPPTPSPLPPNPPRQTNFQAEALANITRLAKIASSAATPHLLAAIDAPACRAILSNQCGASCLAPADKIVDRLHSIVGLAEMTHSFEMVQVNLSHQIFAACCFGVLNPTPPSHCQDHHSDDPGLVDLDRLGLTYFPNLWQTLLLGVSKQVYSHETINDAEIFLYGLRNFTNANNFSWQQASNRLIYTALGECGSPLQSSPDEALPWFVLF